MQPKEIFTFAKSLMVESVEEFDNSFQVKINRKEQKLLSKEVVKNLFVIAV